MRARRADSRRTSLDGTGYACYGRFKLHTRTPRLGRFASLPSLLAVLVFIGPALGCAGAPVQEMSNARQAVRAAERAGATAHAPEELDEARRLLKEAEINLRHGDYRAARDEAELSREKAVAARRVAETATAAAQPQP